MIPNFLDKSQIPHKPGVYKFKDNLNQVIYVGKAIDLYHRVASYFSASSKDPKTSALVPQIKELETVVVESELEALILEANLIKRFRPKFNVRLIDDKDYLYIKVTGEPFPKVVTARRKDLDDSLKYFGPFPSSRTVKETLKRLRRVFPWCSYGAVSKRACFYYHLGQCPGACTGEISQKDYRQIIKRFMAFMEGQKEKLIRDLTKEMNGVAKREQFEKAAEIKNTLAGIGYLTQTNRTHLYLENPNFLQAERARGLAELQTVLGLANYPARVEGYDISNIQGTNSVGSMVVLTEGEMDKSQYRKFKINPPAGGSGRINDVGHMREVVRRRLNHPEWQLPDLILVDGGKGQARAANYELRIMNYEVPVFGLAKRMEWLYCVDGSIIKLPKSSPALKLLQKIRDEAHRFAITYHRRLRNRQMLRV